MSIYNLLSIETPRLLIRPIKLGDEVAISEAIQRSLPELQRWMPWANDPSFETTQSFVKRADHGWRTGKSVDFPMVAIHKESGKIISATGFNEKSELSRPCFEIGYWLDREYQGQGLATEMVTALTRCALDALKATRVQMCTQKENTKSVALIERCGYKLEATMKNYCLDCESQQPADSLLYACCDSDTLPNIEVKWSHNDDKQFEQLPSLPLSSTASQNPVTQAQLTTERLTLLPPQQEYAEALFDSLSNSLDEVSPWFSWANKNLDLEGLQKYHLEEGIQNAADIYAHDHLFFLVLDKSHNTLLGEVWFKVMDWSVPNLMLNYWFDTRQTGKGYATEAVTEMLRYAFADLRAKRVQLHISETNTKSLHLAKRLNFSYEGQLKNQIKNFITGEIVNSELFAMTGLNNESE